MADPAKMKCAVDGCGFGAEAIVHWRLGKGVDMPFTGGKVGSLEGIHHVMQLCRDHRIASVDTHPRPYKVRTTAWYEKAASFDILFDLQGRMLLPGVASK